MADIVKGIFGQKPERPAGKFRTIVRSEIAKVLDKLWRDRVDRAEAVAEIAKEQFEALEPFLQLDINAVVQQPPGIDPDVFRRLVKELDEQLRAQYDAAILRLHRQAAEAIASTAGGAVVAVVAN